MQWDDRSVFITGAGGFIGSHLIEHLLALQADVTAFIRYNSRNDWGMLEYLNPEQLSQINIVMGDLRDGDAIRTATKDIDLIIHLGSLISIPYSYLHPRETIETNIMGTLNVLMAAKENGTVKVLHTSTSEVYGTAIYVPIDENHPLQGQSPYSASKIGADKIAESFYRAYHLPVTTLRPFNTYGPRQSSRAIIPTIITQVLTTGRVQLGSLHPTRDFTFIHDTVRGFIAAAEANHLEGETINIGSNFEISIGELAEKIAMLCNREVEICYDAERSRPATSEVERLWCNNSRARSVLGWSPQVSLEEGLRITIEWISNHIDFYKPHIYTR